MIDKYTRRHRAEANLTLSPVFFPLVKTEEKGWRPLELKAPGGREAAAQCGLHNKRSPVSPLSLRVERYKEKKPTEGCESSWMEAVRIPFYERLRSPRRFPRFSLSTLR